MNNYEMKKANQPSNLSYLRTVSCVGEPLPGAMQSIRDNDIRLFSDIISNDEEAGCDLVLADDHWINQILEDEAGNTLLTAAISRQLHHFVEVLVKAGASTDLYNPDLDKYPLHVAAEVGDVKTAKLLLTLKPNNNKANINAVNKAGRTALHLAAEKTSIEFADFLLQQPRIDVNVADKKGGMTPLYLAVKAKSPQLVEMLIEAGASLNSICMGRSVQQHIEQKMPAFKLDSVHPSRAPLEREVSVSATERLFALVDRAALNNQQTKSNINEFSSLLLQLDTKALTNLKSGGISLLQKICAGGLDEYLEVLLGEGVDANHCPAESLSAPLLLAAYRGKAKVLEVLRAHQADFTVTVKQTRETVLHRLLIREQAMPDTDFQACLDLLLSKEDPELKRSIDSIINRMDGQGNTALHYATQRWDQGTVRRLLERGANIGIKNKWGEIPIEKIEPETMEGFLDEFCLQSTKDVNHDDFELTFKYTFLAPSVETLPFDLQGVNSQDEETIKLTDRNKRNRIALPETESLWYMGQTLAHRHLLKHPVITSFMAVKWSRIRRYFNRNLRFYALFVIILTWYVFEEFGGQSLRNESTGRIDFWFGLFVAFAVAMVVFVIKDWVSDVKDLVLQEKLSEGRIRSSSSKSIIKLIFSNWLECGYLAGLTVILWLGANSLYYVLLILVIGLAVREVFQLLVSLRRYILDLENWMELVLIALCFSLLLRPDPDQEEEAAKERELKRHLAAISLLLSWAELITFVAKHPWLNIYNVYVTMFYKVLSTFFFFLLWYIFFILAFGLGFYIMLHNDFNNATVTDDDYVFFNSPALALVKTSTMFVGELEFSDIPVNLDGDMAPVSYLFFLSFVFLIVVVLMNLLNGLAVSDTGAIQEHSEIVSYLSRVGTISYYEMGLLGDPFQLLASWPRLGFMKNLPSLSCFGQLYKNETSRNIFQRMTGAKDILLFYNVLPDKQLKVKPNRKFDTCGGSDALPREIIDSARKIVVEKEKKKERTELEDRMDTIEQKLDQILAKMQ